MTFTPPEDLRRAQWFTFTEPDYEPAAVCKTAGPYGSYRYWTFENEADYRAFVGEYLSKLQVPSP